MKEQIENQDPSLVDTNVYFKFNLNSSSYPYLREKHWFNGSEERFGKEIWVKPKEITVSSVAEQFLEKAIKVVEENLSDSNFGAEEFSREIGMSRMQLHRKLTALTGQSTSDFLRSMRLKRAAQ
jgi:AraC-like DNA-binding protein